MENQSSSSVAAVSSLQWKWVAIGVAVGAAVMAVIVGITASGFHNLFIPSLIACTGFVVTGIIVGYYSPGITLREAAIGGAILAVLLLLSVLMFFGSSMSVTQTLIALVFGFVLALVGGWVGESLQQDKAERLRGLHWRWVFVGVIVTVVLNSLGVFGLAPMMNYNLAYVFVSFLVTFVLAGFIVGFFSAGVTIKEAALAGLLAIVIDWLLVEVGLEITVPAGSMLFGMTAGFLLSFAGAWVGERLQASREKRTPE